MRHVFIINPVSGQKDAGQHLLPGIEAAIQIKGMGSMEATLGNQRFNMRVFYTDPEFFKVFQMTFVEGSAEGALSGPSSMVLTRPRAEALFGSTTAAMGRLLRMADTDYTVTAVVEPLPLNTHFTFEALVRTETWGYYAMAGGMEYITFYLIGAGQSVDHVRRAIEAEYTAQLKPMRDYLNVNVYGETERLTDIYLRGRADWTLGKRNSMGFIWMLSSLALVILAFAVTNFINLFAAQGETRMKEIGVRKTYGAQPGNLVRQLFSEVGMLVAFAFALGLLLAVYFTPAFSDLIGKEIDVSQFFNPTFMAFTAALLLLTVVLSASYTSFYLSRLNPLDILGKRLRFGKGRLITAVVCFQSVVTIVLFTLIIVVNRQANYLKQIPVGFDPANVMSVRVNSSFADNYEAVIQELRSIPVVGEAAGSFHNVGVSGSYSGQSINLLSAEGGRSINEYSIFPGLGELMRFNLAEGKFPDNETPGNPIVLNQAAVEMLGLEYPVVDRQVRYLGRPATVVGVVGDFIYDEPDAHVQPLVFSLPRGLSYIFVRLLDGTDRDEARAAIHAALRKFDPDFVLSPMWGEDVYESKFSTINSQGRILFVGSALSIVLAMLGLLAIHLYSAVRRTKEIGIRRINGAGRGEIFMLLSRDMLRWILLAGVVAMPVAWWLGTRYLSGVANHVSLNAAMFIVPVVIQMVVALAVTSGVSLRACTQNPVESLKYE